ncbi:hypothetical protein CfE428DRAFT_6218 [Chthoniobacter flavus Ellin428]|uniref:Radical SAM domain protein n=1 Tax=Chthoniobacter flavus Ellin428 TaxID=497964 RepID=B4DBC7_9BACT|nr:hypothetical protein [Chthoniobacter flavus]EDY16217.1 hypothetical protein CfE428DRAFT_6218 [Chthoniobacter flavus Ellin428]
MRTREDFTRWLGKPPPGLEWLEVEGLLGDPDAWAVAAQGASAIPLDVVMSNPATEFSDLYRLVDVHMVRDVRVTMPATPGFMKALRLAAALQLPVRLLPGQPSAESLSELHAAADFYLHDSVVEAPVEFFHSFLAAAQGVISPTLWEILEQDPAIFVRLDIDARVRRSSDFVTTHLRQLVGQNAECATCHWQAQCAGYFKQPDPTYSCHGVKELFAYLQTAAEEIAHDLVSGVPVTS